MALNTENIILHHSNIKKINNDTIPYGYPQIEYSHKDTNLITKTSFKKNMEHLFQKMKNPIDKIIELNDIYVDLEKSIGLISRNYNLIISQLFDLNQIILEKNEQLIEKIFNYEQDDNQDDEQVDNQIDEQVDNQIDEQVDN